MNLKKSLFVLFIPFTLKAYDLEKRDLSKKFILSSQVINQVKIVKIDINQDKKVDRIESFKKDFLFLLEEDTDYSGSIDQWTSYFEYVDKKNPTEIIKKDTNGDGRADRVLTIHQDLKNQLLITHTEVDSNFDGIFEKKYSRTRDLYEYQKCITEFKSLNLIKESLNQSEKITYDINGFFDTSWGYRIHKSCIDQFGKDVFLNTLKSGINEGMQCLENLAKDKSTPQNPNSPFALVNKFDFMLENNKRNNKKVTISCNIDIDHNLATASPAHTTESPAPNIEHPFILISPKHLMSNKSPDRLTNLKGTLFHEQLHNLGITHADNIEYAYACESYCLNSKSQEEKDIAHKICSGAHKNYLDENYLADLKKFAALNERNYIYTDILDIYLQENPRKIWAYTDKIETEIPEMDPLIKAEESPVKYEMYNLLKNNLKPLSRTEEDQINQIQSQLTGRSQVPETTQIASLTATSQYSFAINNNSQEAMNQLLKNKESLKKYLLRTPFKNAKEEQNRLHVINDFKKLLTEVHSQPVYSKHYHVNATKIAGDFLTEFGWK